MSERERIKRELDVLKKEHRGISWAYYKALDRNSPRLPQITAKMDELGSAITELKQRIRDLDFATA